MKRLILLRHAQATSQRGLHDFDRTLSQAGENDASLIGQWISAQATPELVLCSPAKRTRQTLEYSKIKAQTIYPPELYLASQETLLHTIQKIEDVNTVLLIAHNPGIGMLAHILIKKSFQNEISQKYATATATVLDFTIPTWQALTQGSGIYVAQSNPQNLNSFSPQQPL